MLEIELFSRQLLILFSLYTAEITSIAPNKQLLMLRVLLIDHTHYE